jgi:hypothetical protein
LSSNNDGARFYWKQIGRVGLGNPNTRKEKPIKFLLLQSDLVHVRQNPDLAIRFNGYAALTFLFLDVLISVCKI